MNGLAWPGVRAKNVWRNGKNIFFDILWYSMRKKTSVHMNIEHGIFTPFVFFVLGSVGKWCSMFHKHLTQKIANKKVIGIKK